MQLLLACDIPVTTLKTQSLHFDPQITSSNIINTECARGGFVKQAVNFLGGPSCLYLSYFHNVSSLPLNVLGSACGPHNSGG